MVNKLITRYELTGKGKTVLMLHGWGDTLASFHDLTNALSEKYQVLVLDLPGFGQTQAPAETWDLLDYAKFVRDFLKKTKLKPSIIIGHSNGGAIAIKGMGNGVLTADKLVLLASSGIRGEYKGKVKVARLITKTGKAFAKPLPSSMRFRLRRKVYDTIGSDMLVAEKLQETFKKIVADDVRPDAAKIKIPALLLYGDKDTATPLSYGKKLADEMPKAILDDISPAGHFVHHDQPEMVLNRIRDFLK